MTAEEFQKYVAHPELINGSEVTQLKEMLDEFPFCMTVRLLYTLSLKNKKSVLFDEQLNLTSAYSSDRKILYYLMNPVEEKSTVNELIGDFDSLPENPNEEKIAKAEEVRLSRPFEIRQGSEVSKEKDDLSLNYLHEIVGNSLTFEMLDQSSDVLDSSKVEKSKESPRPQDSNEKHEFSEWLKIFNGDEVVVHKTPTSLIDEFLKNDPKIDFKPTEPEDFRVNLAKSSAQERDDMITETLAKIHVEQGNKREAIEIYEKLSLKYPEKRSYFAGQIKFLKQNPS